MSWDYFAMGHSLDFFLQSLLLAVSLPSASLLSPSLEEVLKLLLIVHFILYFSERNYMCGLEEREKGSVGGWVKRIWESNIPSEPNQ